jgi:3-methyladenine DNA glycosylase/8-oxoguanine DNA glycosylase
MRALGVASPAAAQRAAQRWQPWRARAVVHLWRRAQAASPI